MLFTLTISTLGIILFSSALSVQRSNFLPKGKFNYTCTKVGNFSHPTARTQYIYCDKKLVPNARNCPICKTDHICCPDSRLHFNAGTGGCGWAGKNCGILPYTTSTTPLSVPSVSQNQRSPIPGSECGLNCRQIGNCSCYFTCNPGSDGTSGIWERFMCDDGDFWNPNVGPHGGICDFWENLSSIIQEKYRNDSQCRTPLLPCAWRADAQCANKYFFLPENSKNIADELNLSCPVSNGERRYWDQQTRTCRKSCPSSPCDIC